MKKIIWLLVFLSLVTIVFAEQDQLIPSDLTEKTLAVGETWPNIVCNYNIMVQSIDARASPKIAWIVVYDGDVKKDDAILKEGDLYNYVEESFMGSTNVLMFTINVSKIFSGDTDMAKFDDIHVNSLAMEACGKEQIYQKVGIISKIRSAITTFIAKIFMRTKKEQSKEEPEAVNEPVTNHIDSEQKAEPKPAESPKITGQLAIEKSFDVYAKENALSSSGTALDTGIDLKEGDMLEISVSNYDTWSLGSGDLTCNADGLGSNNPYGGDYGTINPGTGVAFTYGALVGSIGDGMNWFLVGTDLKKTMTLHGRLYLLCWDDNPDDNRGYITVDVKVNK